MAYLYWGLHRCWASALPLFWAIKHTPAALRFELMLEETSVKIKPKTNEKSRCVFRAFVNETNKHFICLTLSLLSNKYIVTLSLSPQKDVFSELILFCVSSPLHPPRSAFISFPTNRHKMSCTSCLNTSAVQTAWLMRMDVPQQS